MCGADLIHRSDDQPEAIKNRLNVYNSQTASVLGYYENKGILKNIDAIGNIDAIFVTIYEALGL